MSIYRFCCVWPSWFDLRGSSCVGFRVRSHFGSSHFGSSGHYRSNLCSNCQHRVGPVSKSSCGLPPTASCRFSSSLSPHRLSHRARPALGERQLHNDAHSQGRSRCPVPELARNLLSPPSSLRNSLYSLLNPQNSSRYQRRISASSQGAVLPVLTTFSVLCTWRRLAYRYP